jgi:hypothetical protein
MWNSPVGVKTVHFWCVFFFSFCTKHGDNLLTSTFAGPPL